MPIPRFEVAIGAIDGVNTLFSVSRAYTAGTTGVFLNGQLKRMDLDDGWFETNPLLGQIQLKEAPLVLDQVQVFFLDTSTSTTEEEVTSMRGRFQGDAEIAGRIIEEDLLRGQLLHDNEVVLVGRLIEEN